MFSVTVVWAPAKAANKDSERAIDFIDKNDWFSQLS